MIKITFKRGDQVAYVPDLANGNIFHPRAQFGFVTSVSEPKGAFVFVRYWSKINPNELRTKTNSEATSKNSLVLFKFKPQEEVDKLLKTL